jgi:hypothetical protein
LADGGISADTQPVMPTVGKADRHDSLGWIATALLGAPAVIAALWGGYRFVIGSFPVRRAVDRPGWVTPPSLPARAVVDVLFLVIWILALNLLVAGLIIGWVWIRRLGKPWQRSILLILVAASGVAVNFWAWGQASGLRTSGLLMLTGAGLGLLATYALLRPRAPRREPG